MTWRAEAPMSGPIPIIDQTGHRGGESYSLRAVQDGADVATPTKGIGTTGRSSPRCARGRGSLATCPAI